MRHLVFICRPCLASIRKQRGQALSRIAVFSWITSTSPITARSRSRTANFTVLHALRKTGGEPTTLAACLPTDSGALSKTALDESTSLPAKPPDATGSEDVDRADQAARAELEEALAAASSDVEYSATEPRHDSYSRADHDGAIEPEADRLDEERPNSEADEADELRDPGVVWDEVEATLFNPDDSRTLMAVSAEGASDRAQWEVFCAATAKTVESNTVLSSCKTSEEYFGAIDASPGLKIDRERREKMCWKMWRRWFVPLAEELDRDLGQKSASPSRQAHPKYNMLELALGVDAMKKKWRRLSPQARDNRWPHLITQCLIYNPQTVPLVLQATVEDRIARPYILRDVFKLLGEQVEYYRAKHRKRFSNDVVISLLCTLRNTAPGSFWVLQYVVVKIIRFASKSQNVSELHGALRDYGCRLTLATKMHFATRLAQTVTHRLHALDLLREMVRDDQFDINSVQGLALVTSLLAVLNHGQVAPDRSRPKEMPPTEVAQEVYETVMSLGLKPNLISFTAIMQALCESKQLSKAWDVFDLMCAHGIEPDAQTFVVLHNGSKNHSDYVSAKRVIELADKLGIHHRFLWNDFLHMIYTEARRTAGESDPKYRRKVLPVFSTMLTVYNRLFEHGPLQRFLITNLKHHSLEANAVSGDLEWAWPSLRVSLEIISSLPSRGLLEPGTDTLYIMLIGYIRGFSRPHSILAFYQHFNNLLKSGDPHAVQFVQETGPKLHNAILMALCEHRDMLRYTLDILSQMLRDTIEAELAAEAGAEDTVPRHPEPDIRSWGIILNGFMENREFRQGEAILDMMNQHGIPPQMSTWNQLLAGYLHFNEVGMARDVMDRVRQADLVPDEFTTRIFERLWNHEMTGETVKHLKMMTRRRQELKADPNSTLGKLYPDADARDGDAHADARDGDADTQPPATNQVKRVSAISEYQQLVAELREIASSEAKIANRQIGGGRRERVRKRGTKTDGAHYRND